MVERRSEEPGVGGSIPPPPHLICGYSTMVSALVFQTRDVGSIPITHSINMFKYGFERENRG